MVSSIFKETFANVFVVVAVQEKIVYWTHFKTDDAILKTKIRVLSLRWLKPSISFARSFRPNKSWIEGFSKYWLKLRPLRMFVSSLLHLEIV